MGGRGWGGYSGGKGGKWENYNSIINKYILKNDQPLMKKKERILMRSHLFILSFMSLALGDISVKILLRGISEIFLTMLSSRKLMVS